MRSMSKPKRRPVAFLAAFLGMAVLPIAAAIAAETYYTVRPLFLPAPDEGPRARDFVIQNFGPVGIGITLGQPAFTMVVNHVEAGSPAAATGRLERGQIIESINGVVLKDRDPREILGDVITEAEATDGVVRLTIKELGDVVVNIPVKGVYSETWPLNCSKSDKIVRKLADLLHTQQRPSWGSALFLLSTGEEQDLEVVRKWFSGRDQIGSYPWHAGYLGIAYGEYYLRTQDETVLPAIQRMVDRLKETMYNGGWSGRGDGSSFTYSTGTGQMHAAGVHCITFLMLAKMCGVEVDDYLFHESLKTFFRFAGRENVPYGDGWPEGGFRDNGKSAGLAVAMAAAARLTPDGESSIYAAARDHAGMKSFYATSWFHSAHTGGGIGEIWRNAAMSMLHERRPVQHRSFLDTRRWVMELSRRHTGGVGIGGLVDRYDKAAGEQEHSWGNYFALTYTIPRRNLVIFGAPLPAWARQYQLPERPWGRPADDSFVKREPVPAELLAMDSDPFTMEDLLREEVRTHSSLAFFDRLADPAVSDKTLATLLRHPEMGYRVATMRTITGLGRDQFVLPLLQSSDPRLRHAGLLAITGMFKGRPLPNDKLTPEMFERVGSLIEDPDESLWVVQQAMLALKRAPVERVVRHRDTILRYMQHEDWFLQTRAVDALVPIAAHPDHYQAILPTMLRTIAAFTTDQAFAPVGALRDHLGRASRPVQDYALEQLMEAYATIPEVMTFPGGRVMPNGAPIVRDRVAGMINVLPGGEDRLNALAE